MKLAKVAANKNYHNSWQELLKAKEEQFKNGLREFKRLIKIWRDNQLGFKADNSEKAILIQYARYLQEHNNIDILNEFVSFQRITSKEDLKNIKNEKKVFLGASFIHQKLWKLDFNKIFIEKISTLQEQKIIQLFFLIYILTQGYICFSKGKFNSLQLIQMTNRHGLQYYTHNWSIDNERRYLLFSIGIHKLPQYNFKGTLKSFSYVYVLACEDVVTKQFFFNQKKMSKLIQNLQDHNDQNPKFNYQKNQLILNQQAIDKKLIYFNLKNTLKSQQSTMKIYPSIYKNRIIPEQRQNQLFKELQQFKFRVEKFREHRIRTRYFATKNKFQTPIEAEKRKINIIQQLELQTMRNTKIRFDSYSNSLQILEEIPNFKYALTNQQRQVICNNGNSVVVGRSGTGKTTCAMLRLYSFQSSIKMQEYNNLKKQQNTLETPTKCKMIILDEIKLTKNIFLTFSSILIDEIKKQYNDMIYQIKQKHSQQCKICEEAQKKYTPVTQNEDPIDKLRRIKQDQQKKVISLSYIQADDFPGFFTIQHFIKIIDKTIQRPFYVQQKQKNKSYNIEIKYQNINIYSYNAKQITLQQQIQAVQVDYNFFFHHIWEKLPKQLTKPQVEFCLLTPSIVWAEIFSILKGSINSYLCPGGHISFKMYLQHPQSLFNNQLQQKMQQYKKKVFKILKSYLQWCKLEKAFDLMDVVSHNLKEIQFYGYQGPKINYMFVDEVQDLTASTTLLVSKMVINNIFYCGDTAQAITKGVSFRFQDLKLLFNKQYCKSALCLQPPSDVQNLTVNFRSHNSIIQIANTVVSSLEIFFPNSINKLKKQKSDLIGPKPFIILNQHESMIFQLLCSAENQVQQQIQIGLRELLNKDKPKAISQMKNKKKKGKKQNSHYNQDEHEYKSKKFNNQQVIIVRNQYQKQKLPQFLTKGIILTPQTAKGLQYDEIILYNFFSSCPILDKWNSLFQHLESIQVYQDQQSFQKQLTRRDEQQKKIEKIISLQTKEKLGYDKQKKQYRTWSIIAKQSLKGLNVNLYHELQTQLKILYTSITRARSVFVIYDSKIPKNLLKIWELMDLFIAIDKTNVQINHDEIREYVYVNQKHVKYINQKEKWFKAGSQMLARNDFQNAKKCFQNIKRFDLVQRIQARQIQIKAQNLLYRNKKEFQKLQNYQKDQKKIAKVKLQKEKKQIYKLYQKAGQIYEKWKRFFDAGKAYFQIEKYDLALKFFKNIEGEDHYKQMAICCQHLKRYQEALIYFKQLKDIEGVCTCYIELKKWKQLGSQLIDNPQYTSNSQYQNQLTLSLRKKIVCEVINNNSIFCQYLNLVKNQKFEQNSKRLFSIQQTNKIISTVIKTFQLKNYNKFIDILGKNNQFQKLKDKKILLQEERIVLDKQIAQLMKLKQQKLKLFQQSNQCNDKQSNILKKLQKYTLTNSIQSLKANQQYNQLRSSLEKIQNMSKIQKKQLQNILSQTNTKFEMKRNNIEDIKCVEKQIQIYRKQNIENFQEQKYFLHNELYSMHQKSNQIRNEQNQPNSIYKANKLSHEQQKQKLQRQIQIERVSLALAQQILQILDKFQNFVDYHAQSYKQKSPHFYIREMVNELSNTNGFSFLKKCDYVGNRYSSLLVINKFQKLHGLSIKQILGCFLPFSRNNIQNRCKNSRKQEQILKVNPEQNLIIDKNIYFLRSLSIKVLQHSIPSLIFNGQVYYERLLNQVIFGLILQGFYRQVFMFLSLKSAWNLAYLFSSNEDMIQLIAKITCKFGNLRFNKQSFLFIDDQFILRVYSQARMMNVYSIQKVFIAYDECQQQSFLCQRVSQQNFDIDQNTVSRIYNQQATQKIKAMKKQKKILQSQIKEIEISIVGYEKMKNYVLQSEEYKRIRKQLQIEQENQQKILQDKTKKLKNAQVQQKKVKISKGQKSKIQEEINILQKNQLFEQLQIKKKEYQSKLNLQKQGAQSIQRQKSQISSSKKRIYEIKKEIKQISQKISLAERNTQNLNKIQQQLIRKKNQKADLKDKIPKQLSIQNYQELVSFVTKNILEKRKKQQVKYSLLEKKKSRKQTILSKSFFPSAQKYQFVNSYISNYWNAQTMLKILKDGCNIESLLKQKGKQIQLCNIIMFYLAYVFNRQFYNLVNKTIEKQQLQYQKNIASKQSPIIKEIQKKQGQFKKYENQLEKISQSKREQFFYFQKDYIKELKQKKKNAINEIKNEIKRCQDDLHNIRNLHNLQIRHPCDLLKNFPRNIYNKITFEQFSLDNKFLSFLLGFFQCKIIRQCQPLEFLEGEYVLVGHNSIIIDKLQNKFAYYFDQQNKNVLCRFVDVKQIIVNYIKQKHLSLFKNIEDSKKISPTELPSTNTIKIENQRILKLTKMAYQDEPIKQTYDKYENNILLNTLATQKRSILQYFLKNQFKDENGYFLAVYQLREYYLLQKLIKSMKLFNYDILKQITRRIKVLKQQYIKWMSK